MTVSSSTNVVILSADGSTHSFSFTFKIFAASDLKVIVRSAAGVETEKTLSSLAASQGRADITQEEVVRAEALNDGETQREISRILQQSASQSSLDVGARKTQGGAVSGLTEV